MAKGKFPDYKGKVCDEMRNELGNIALWVQSDEEKKSAKSPVIRGIITFAKDLPAAASSKIRVAVWNAERKADSSESAAPAAKTETPAVEAAAATSEPATE